MKFAKGFLHGRFALEASLAYGRLSPFLCINVDHIAWFTFGIAIQKGRWLEAIHQNRMALAFIMPIVFCWLTGALMREGLWLGGKQMCLCSSRGGVNLIAFLGATSVYFLVSFDRVIPGGYRVFSNTFWFYCCHFPICMWIKSIDVCSPTKTILLCWLLRY